MGRKGGEIVKKNTLGSLVFALFWIVLIGGFLWSSLAPNPPAPSRQETASVSRQDTVDQILHGGRSDDFDEGRSEGYDEGYGEGYDDGRDEGYEEGYREGSVYGWKDRMDEVGEFFVDGATEYAISNSGLHPEEALYILEEGGTDEEIADAVYCLYCFYLYFYNSEY